MWRRFLLFCRVVRLKGISLFKKGVEDLKVPFFWGYLRTFFHRYSVKQYHLIHERENLLTLIAWSGYERLDTTQEGRLFLRKSKWSKGVFWIKNLLFFGAPKARLLKVIYFVFLSYALEITNPFDKEILKRFLDKKISFLQRLLKKVKALEPEVNAFLIEVNIEKYRRNSLLQERIIRKSLKASKQKESELVEEVKAALKKGYSPLLVTRGLSGSYWMRGLNRQIVGIFKPFDEEAHAPNNPIGPMMQGALGQQKMRSGIYVGEAAHREVAAFVVDQFFGFGIVPITSYATFTHPVFYHYRDPRYQKKTPKTKRGSFQEYLEGFISYTQASPEEAGALPLDEYQLLIVLDVIIGNSDRNTGNILLGDKKIAAIDHGLSFATFNYHLSTWYWSHLPQGKEKWLSSVIQLLEDFPFERLSWKLQKRCFLDKRALDRLVERVTLFRSGVMAGLCPHDLAPLMKDENLVAIYELSGEALEKKCKELVEQRNAEKEANP